MKGTAGFLIAALVLAAVGGGALAVGRFERDMAEAQQNLATLQYEDAKARLADADRYAGYAAWLPGMSDGVQNELRVRRAALSYWERDYDTARAVAPETGATMPGDIELQLIMANAGFRAGQATAKDRPSTLQALDEAVGSYLGVLKSEEWNEDAAYNYEYLVRLRDEFARNPRQQQPPPPKQEKNSSNGQAGAPEQTADTRKFEIYIPLESTERTKAAEAGKATPNKRKG